AVRPDVGDDPRGRHRPAPRQAALAAEPDRRRAPGCAAVQRHGARQHRVRPAGRNAGAGRGGGARGECARLHRPAAQRLRHGGRRARLEPLGRRAPARGDRARSAQGPAHPRTGRGDVRAGRGVGGAGAGGAGAAGQGPHHVHHRAPALDRRRRRPHPRAARRPHRRAGHARGPDGARRVLRIAGPAPDEGAAGRSGLSAAGAGRPAAAERRARLHRTESTDMRDEIQAFLDAHERALKPLHLEARQAAWELITTGAEDAARRAARAAAEVRKLYADAAAFAQVRRWLERGDRLDPLVRRQLVVLELNYRANQLEPALIEELEERAQEIEHIFYTHRAEVQGRMRTDNEIRLLLEQEGDTPLRRAAWEASKSIGAKVAGPLRALARRRNDAARSPGFPDYYTMELELQE